MTEVRKILRLAKLGTRSWMAVFAGDGGI